MREKITSERSHGEPVEGYVGKGLYAHILRRAQDAPTQIMPCCPSADGSISNR